MKYLGIVATVGDSKGNTVASPEDTRRWLAQLHGFLAQQALNKESGSQEILTDELAARQQLVSKARQAGRPLALVVAEVDVQARPVTIAIPDTTVKLVDA